MKVKIKKLHPDAVIPQYSKTGDAGLDLTAVSDAIYSGKYIAYDIGLAVEIPKGFVGLLFPRSSISVYDLVQANSVGVIDSGFRGAIQTRFKITQYEDTVRYKKGDRVAQLIILPHPSIEFEEVEELTVSERGEGGHGSTGK